MTESNLFARKLNVASWVSPTETEGPGARFALWLQGCPFRCPGCCNPHLWDIREARVMAVAEVLELIAAERRRIEGVTFLGGEPIIQAQGLALLAQEIRKLDLSLMVFTGYTYGFLVRGELPGVPELLHVADLLVDGLYMRNLPEQRRRWIGSSNQKLYFLTDRYSPGIELLGETAEKTAVREAQAEDEATASRETEIHIFQQEKKLTINGWPFPDLSQQLVQKLQQEGIKLQGWSG